MFRLQQNVCNTLHSYSQKAGMMVNRERLNNMRYYSVQKFKDDLKFTNVQKQKDDLYLANDVRIDMAKPIEIMHFKVYVQYVLELVCLNKLFFSATDLSDGRVLNSKRPPLSNMRDFVLAGAIDSMIILPVSSKVMNERVCNIVLRCKQQYYLQSVLNGKMDGSQAIGHLLSSSFMILDNIEFEFHRNT